MKRCLKNKAEKDSKDKEIYFKYVKLLETGKAKSKDCLKNPDKNVLTQQIRIKKNENMFKGIDNILNKYEDLKTNKMKRNVENSEPIKFSNQINSFDFGNIKYSPKKDLELSERVKRIEEEINKFI